MINCGFLTMDKGGPIHRYSSLNYVFYGQHYHSFCRSQTELGWQMWRQVLQLLDSDICCPIEGCAHGCHGNRSSLVRRAHTLFLLQNDTCQINVLMMQQILIFYFSLRSISGFCTSNMYKGYFYFKVVTILDFKYVTVVF